MPSHTIRIVQVFRVEREIIIAVDAPDLHTAIELQSENSAPPFDDPRWRSSHTLENEQVDIAPTDSQP